MFQLLAQLLLLILASYTIWIVYRNRKSGKNKINVPPGSFGWPIVGESLLLRRALIDGVPEKFIQQRIKKHGSPLVFKTLLFGNPVAVFCGPASNKFLFGNDNKLVGSWLPPPARKLFGRSLLTAHGDEAKWLRKVISQYLSPDAYATHYGPTMDVVTRRHIQLHWKGKEEVNVFETVKLYAFELACRLFMSLEEPGHVAKLGSLFYIFLKGVLELPIDFPGTRFYCAKKAASGIRTELAAIIEARRVALVQGEASSSQDLLSHFLTYSDENGRLLTETEIANNILVLLFAGNDTSTVGITLLMKKLAEHPDVYDKVFEEQLEISKAKEAGESLKWEHIQSMKYSMNVISETLRINPPVIGGFKEALVDFEYAGYTIPKGWKVLWSAPATHKDNANFEDPTRFDPSRFEGGGPKPFTFVPFGGGPRMCIGKELSRLQILVFLHNVITNFKWDLLVPDELITYDPFATPSKGLPIRLHPHQA